mmetsp:Transcript_19222/g.31934  ORF Transcript_19222/g.31934 Transcript_19222/m.31934 type:complete len:174 (-) Transcript_19222:208-729(-)|eukprot:CAMPEP_0119006712 /NCGR_PEP_ID=MMETSP1176-20130426/2482_1 /TAXON_ID=265551 /ORGANISM="Synedropsis recta cf, Strain CCMP1620" /LENGTH=173 /DNA_ID=CAMNT_0006958677 /DNA_START=39 /DNA_END=560 /DNA_ORIENTATION=+
MNQVATILGFDLPVLKARKAVMKSSRRAPQHKEEEMCHIISHRDSLLMMEKHHHREAKDDDTASTASASDSDLSFDISHGVTWHDNLVTEVRTRPYTTIHEKYDLFYSDYDYAEFRREAYGYGRREKVVKFSDTMVTEVFIIPKVEEPSQMYYSKKELQRFLDEFIASLGNSF